MKHTAAVLALIALSSCSYYISDLEIVNSGDESIENVMILAGSRKVYLGQIRPGGHVHVTVHFPGEAGEGKSRLSWTANGRRLSTEICYYTDFDPPRGAILISADHVTFDCLT